MIIFNAILSEFSKSYNDLYRKEIRLV